MKWLLQNVRRRAAFALRNPGYAVNAIVDELAQSDEKFIGHVTRVSPGQIRAFRVAYRPVRPDGRVVPDRARGQVPVAYLVVQDGFDQSAVEASCRALLASFKMPREFVIVDKLPRTALGKIQKHLLTR